MTEDGVAHPVRTSASPTTVQPSTDEPAGVAADALPESAERRKRQQREWTAHERAEARAKVAAAAEGVAKLRQVRSGGVSLETHDQTIGAARR